MRNTRSSTRSNKATHEQQTLWLSSLPEELLVEVGRSCLSDWSRLSLACRHLRTLLMPLEPEVRARLIRWTAVGLRLHQISDHDRMLTGGVNPMQAPWAMGTPLPTNGISKWFIRKKRWGQYQLSPKRFDGAKMARVSEGPRIGKKSTKSTKYSPRDEILDLDSIMFVIGLVKMIHFLLNRSA